MFYCTITKLAGQILLFALFFNLSGILLNAQSCLPDGITLDSQEAIDNFATNYLGCIEILGDVIIAESSPGAISNLNGLIQVRTISGNLHIQANQSLQSLNGLDSLSNIQLSIEITNNAALSNLGALRQINIINGFLRIEYNPALSTLHGLHSITSLGGRLQMISNDALIDLTGLNALQYLENVTIQKHDQLQTLQGLNALISTKALILIDNPALISLNALENLEIISGTLLVSDNPALVDLSGFPKVTTLGGLKINNNDALTSLSELSHIQTIVPIPGGDPSISIGSNDALSNLKGLESLEYIPGNFLLYNNPQLTSLDALLGLEYIAGNLNIVTNNQLLNLDGLANLSEIDGELFILENAILNNLDGLSQLWHINGPLFINGNPNLSSLSGLDNIDPFSISELILMGGEQLMLCEVKSVCRFLENDLPTTIENNASGCNSIMEVENACLALPLEQINSLESALWIYPNPTTDQLFIDAPSTSTLAYELINITGQSIDQGFLEEGILNTTWLPDGIYYLKIRLNQKLFVQRFVKTRK